MAGVGPPPKEPSERRRRNATVEIKVVAADGVLRGPDLPASFHVFDGEQFVEAEWPDQTAAWWDTWRRSAQSTTFTETDWSFLLDTAVLHAEYWLGDRKVAAELRLRVAKFGATVEDRARLKIDATPPTDPGSRRAPVKRAASSARKARLLKVVGGTEEA